MKKLQYTGALTLFFFTSFLFQYCDDGCGSKAVSRGVVKDYTFNSVFTHNAQGAYVFLPSDSVPMPAGDTVFLNFTSNIQYSSGIRNRSGDLFACDPVFPEVLALGDSLRVIAIDAFDAAHPAGTDVSALFTLCRNQYDVNGRFMPNDEALSAFSKFNTDHNLNLALHTRPDPGAIRFRLLVYKQDTGSAVISETPPIRFY